MSFPASIALDIKSSEILYLRNAYRKLKVENRLLREFFDDTGGVNCKSFIEALKHIKENNDKTIQISKGSTREC